MGKLFNIFTAFFAAIGSFLFGYDSGIIATVIAVPTFTQKFKPGNAILGAIVSTFAGGCFFGAILAGWSSDRLGRKRTIQLGCLVALLGCGLQTGANSLGTLLAGRVIAGFAIGILSMVVPLYNAEIAPPSSRGFVVGLAQLQIGIGFVVAQWGGYGCSFLEGDKQWRIQLGIQMIPAFILLVGIHFLPFSPRWLIEQNRDDEAHAVILRLHASSGHSKEVAEKEFAIMRDTIKAELLVRSNNLSDLWATPSMRKRTAVACGIQIMTQLTGINVLGYFGPILYAELGITGHTLLLIQGIYSAGGTVATVFFMFLVIDKVGRRKPLVFGGYMLAAVFSVMAAIIHNFPPDGPRNTSAQRAGIAMVFMVSIVFSMSYGTVSWVMSSEVFPIRTRSLGVAAATCSNWAFNVLLAQVSPMGLNQAGWRYILAFVVFNAVNSTLVLIFFPETKGLSLEEMAILFGDNVDEVDVLKSHGVEVIQSDIHGEDETKKTSDEVV